MANKYKVFVRQGYGKNAVLLKEIKSFDLDFAHMDWATALAEQLQYTSSSIRLVGMDNDNLPYALLDKRNEPDILVGILFNHTEYEG